MAIESYERLLSHRRRLTFASPPIIRLAVVHQREMISTVFPIQRVTTACILCKAMDFGSVLYFERLCDVKHSSFDKKGNLEVEITWMIVYSQP